MNLAEVKIVCRGFLVKLFIEKSNASFTRAIPFYSGSRHETVHQSSLSLLRFDHNRRCWLTAIVSFSRRKHGVAKAKTPATKEQKATLIDIISWATILPKELIDLQNGVVETEKIKAVEKELAALTKEAERDQKGYGHCPDES